MNALADAASPYLLQHADDPVDWRPWGADAFAEARRRDVPVLVSIGYATCHWCHVMQRESFRDPELAAHLNDRFVAIKIDREEHPDVDAVYMAALQAMRGHGGWPLTAVADPDGRPFFAGTYFPATERPGIPSFRRVLDAIFEAWTDRREALLEDAATLEAHVRRGMAAPTPRVDPAPREAALPDPSADALAALAAQEDPRHGGFGDAPKFPPHAALRWLTTRPEPEAIALAERTLTALHRGGITDPLAGGVARYATDAAWAVPHFEKMLYDNAQLLPRFAEAYLATGTTAHARAAGAIVAWLEAEMRLEDGAFATALDADSLDEDGRSREGAFYAWTGRAFDAAVAEAYGEAEVPFARAAFGVVDAGPFEGANVLREAADAATLADRFDTTDVDADRRLEALRMLLHGVRSRRPRPARDDKVLLSLQGLAIQGLARAARLLEEPRWLDLARGAADAALARFPAGDGTWWRRAHAGRVGLPALLEDHASFGLALLELHHADGDPRWLAAADVHADRIWAAFRDEDGHPTSVAQDARDADGPLRVAPRSVVDGPQPSDALAAAELVWRVARRTGDGDREAWARGVVAPLADGAAKHPQALASALYLLDVMRAPPREVAVTGPDDAGGAELWAAVAARPLDGWIVQRAPTPDDGPLTQGRTTVDGRAAAWVCEGFACRLPLTDPDDLGGALLVG